MKANICLAEGVQKGTHNPSCGDKFICEKYQILEDKDLSEYDTLTEIGSSLNMAERYSDALDYFEEAITLEPNSPEAYFGKARTFYCQKKREESLGYMNKATELDPKNADYWYNKGLVLGLLERYGEALCCIQNADKLDSSKVNSQVRAGLQAKWN
jgi:tetratricopeptide (TPR) repeat protein